MLAALAYAGTRDLCAVARNEARQAGSRNEIEQPQLRRFSQRLQELAERFGTCGAGEPLPGGPPVFILAADCRDNGGDTSNLPAAFQHGYGRKLTK
jgi:hypothetical protein